jgi:ATP-dependent Clp protease ATP-binding subunit ClpA
MYERFSDRARKVMQLAYQEVCQLKHEYVGTEHILLGLIKEGNGIGANVLKNLGIDLRKIRLESEPSNIRWKRPAAWVTATWGPSTCCWAYCASRTAWPPRF